VTTAPAQLGMAVQVMDASNELIAVKDRHGAFIAANRAFRAAAALGERPMGELTNRDLFATEGATALSSSEHLAMQSKTPIRCDVPVSWLGAPRVFHVTCTPWTDHGQCQGVVMAGSLAAADARDGEALESLTSSVGDLAHRLNNALTTVVGLTEWHLYAGQLDAALRVDFQKIRAAAASAEQTAREIQQLIRTATASQAHSAVGDAVVEILPRLRRPGRVLLVDDHADVRTSLQVMIRMLGYDVHGVDSGAAALAWLEHETASLLITDLGMPGMGGAELAAAIARRYQSVPVVLLTGSGDTELDALPGITRVLRKPLRMAKLRQALASLIGAPTRP
jgi:CheY-like chemotaxis protein